MNRAIQKPVDPWRRYKLAAIPILALILIAMLFRNLLGDRTSPPVASPQLRPARVPAPNSTLVTPNVATEKDAKQWPKLEIDEIIAKNPFGPWNTPDALGAVTPNLAIASFGANIHAADSDGTSSGGKQMETLPSERVQAVYHNATGTAAIVDSHIIRPGDQMDNGLQIVNVSDDGVTVKQPQ